jgi:hypothetical protein
VRWAVARENEVERSVVGYNVTVSFGRIWWKIVKRVCSTCGDSKKHFYSKLLAAYHGFSAEKYI